MATERQRKAADLINKGAGVEAALVEAGYGEKFAAGYAAEFAALAAKLGLLNPRTAAKAAAPAPKEA